MCSPEYPWTKMHDHGFKTAVIGNTDTDDTKARLGTMIAMDHDDM